MTNNEADIRAAYQAIMQTEAKKLANKGVNLEGQAFSSLLILKGNLSDAERKGGELLGGADGKALRSALDALGYAPEDWCVAATINAKGEALAQDLFRLTVTSLQPNTLIICDEEAASTVRDAYAQELELLEDPKAAVLEAGTLVNIMGMRLMNLGGFASALDDPKQKQIMWLRLKQVGPLQVPY